MAAVLSDHACIAYGDEIIGDEFVAALATLSPSDTMLRPPDRRAETILDRLARVIMGHADLSPALQSVRDGGGSVDRLVDALTHNNKFDAAKRVTTIVSLQTATLNTQIITAAARGDLAMVVWCHTHGATKIPFESAMGPNFHWAVMWELCDEWAGYDLRHPTPARMEIVEKCREWGADPRAMLVQAARVNSVPIFNKCWAWGVAAEGPETYAKWFQENSPGRGFLDDTRAQWDVAPRLLNMCLAMALFDHAPDTAMRCLRLGATALRLAAAYAGRCGFYAIFMKSCRAASMDASIVAAGLGSALKFSNYDMVARCAGRGGMEVEVMAALTRAEHEGNAPDWDRLRTAALRHRQFTVAFRCARPVV